MFHGQDRVPLIWPLYQGKAMPPHEGLAKSLSGGNLMLICAESGG